MRIVRHRRGRRPRSRVPRLRAGTPRRGAADARGPRHRRSRRRAAAIPPLGARPRRSTRPRSRRSMRTKSTRRGRSATTRRARSRSRSPRGCAARRCCTSRPTTCSTGPRPMPYDETDEPRPLSIYGRAKLAGERSRRPELAGAVHRADGLRVRRRATTTCPGSCARLRAGEVAAGLEDRIGSPTFVDHLAERLVPLALTRPVRHVPPRRPRAGVRGSRCSDGCGRSAICRVRSSPSGPPTSVCRRRGRRARRSRASSWRTCRFPRSRRWTRLCARCSKADRRSGRPGAATARPAAAPHGLHRTEVPRGPRRRASPGPRATATLRAMTTSRARAPRPAPSPRTRATCRSCAHLYWSQEAGARPQAGTRQVREQMLEFVANMRTDERAADAARRAAPGRADAAAPQGEVRAVPRRAVRHAALRPAARRRDGPHGRAVRARARARAPGGGAAAAGRRAPPRRGRRA